MSLQSSNFQLPTPEKSAQRIFLTGSSGFIGSHFLKAALEAGHEVVALRYPGTQPVIPIPESDRLTWIDGDLNSFLPARAEQEEDRRLEIEDPQSGGDRRPEIEDANTPTSQLPSSNSCASAAISQLPSPISCGEAALVHMAAYGVSPQPCTLEKAFQINVTDSLLLVERAINAGISRLFLCGTCMEYGRNAENLEFIPANTAFAPVGAYAASKAAQSMAIAALCQERNIPLTILRLFSVYGEGQHPDNFWPSLRRAALAGDDFPMSPGEQIRDFIPVEQVAQAFLKALELPPSALRSPLVANVGTGHPQTLLAFAEHWWEKWGATGKLIPGALPYRDNEVMRYVPEVKS